jgi:hypothetical protein
MSETDGQLDPEAIDQATAGSHALFKLNQLGFRLDSTTGLHRTFASGWEGQASLYSLDPARSITGSFGSIGEVPREVAAVAALQLAEMILEDEEARRLLPPWRAPSVTLPYG